MGIETLNAMNEGIYLSLLLMIKLIVIITVLCAIVGFVIYLAGIVWFCFEEMRWRITAPQRRHRASPLNTWKSEPYVYNAQVRTHH